MITRICCQHLLQVNHVGHNSCDATACYYDRTDIQLNLLQLTKLVPQVLVPPGMAPAVASGTETLDEKEDRSNMVSSTDEFEWLERQNMITPCQ